MKAACFSLFLCKGIPIHSKLLMWGIVVITLWGQREKETCIRTCYQDWYAYVCGGAQ